MEIERGLADPQEAYKERRKQWGERVDTIPKFHEVPKTAERVFEF